MHAHLDRDGLLERDRERVRRRGERERERERLLPLRRGPRSRSDDLK